MYKFPSGRDYTFDEDVWTSRGIDINGDCRMDFIRTTGTDQHGYIAQG